MILDKIIEEILKEISEATKIDIELLRKALEVSNANNKPNCTIFLLKIRKDAKDIIEEFAQNIIDANIKLIKDITQKGPSVSFNIKMEHFYTDILKTIYNKGTLFGNNNIGENKTVCIDYSSPNIAKVFHIGHFRTTVLGNFIKKLYAFSGYRSVGINYLGDWGKQFGLVLLGYKLHGNAEDLQKDPIKHLFDVYVQINKDIETDPSLDQKAKEIFMKMEQEKDKEYLDLWQKFRSESIQKYKLLYKKINVEFDEYSGESLYDAKGRDIVVKLPFTFTEKGRGLSVDLNELGSPMVIKEDGTSLYLTRDIAAVVDRVERYNPEKLIYVVSSEQNLYFEQLGRLAEKMGYKKGLIKHTNYGLVSGMSTRKGTVKFLEDIIDIATEVMKKEINSNPEKASRIGDIEHTALQLAVSTLVVMDFSAKRIKGYEFDVEKRAKNVNGTGPYFQYAHCRLSSIEERNHNFVTNDLDNIKYDLIDNDAVLQIVYKFLWFEKSVVLCLEDHEPSRIVTYMHDLCSSINALVDKLKVLGVEEDLAKARLLVLSCAKIVLGNALRLLGIEPLTKM